MKKYLWILFCLLATPIAIADSYEVDNQRINVPSPKGFKNIIETPQGKNLAAGYSHSEVLAIYVPEIADVHKTSLGPGVRRFMVLTIPIHPQLRGRMPLLAFVELQKSIKSFATKDGSVVIYENPRAIATMKLFTDTNISLVSVGATVLLPQLPITLQVKSVLESEDDKAWATAAIKNWIESILKENPWIR